MNDLEELIAQRDAEIARADAAEAALETLRGAAVYALSDYEATSSFGTNDHDSKRLASSMLVLSRVVALVPQDLARHARARTLRMAADRAHERHIAKQTTAEWLRALAEEEPK